MMQITFLVFAVIITLLTLHSLRNGCRGAVSSLFVVLFVFFFFSTQNQSLVITKTFPVPMETASPPASDVTETMTVRITRMR